MAFALPACMTPAPTTAVANLPAARGSSLPALIARERQRRRRRLIAWISAAVVVVLAGVGIFLATRPRPAPLGARFRTGAVTQGPLVREVRATGYVEAVSTVSVGAEISGRVATVETDFKQQVKAGQVLARFDIVALEAQRAQSAAMALSARAQFAQARSDLEQARRNKQRADALFAQLAQSVSEHENAVTARF